MTGATRARESSSDESVTYPSSGTAARRRSAVSVGELEPDDAADDAEDESHLEQGRRLVSGRHREGNGETRADPDPDGVGGARRQAAHRVGEATHRGGERDAEDDGRGELREAVGAAEGNGPHGLEDSAEDKDDPRHGDSHGRRLVADRVRRRSSGRPGGLWPPPSHAPPPPRSSTRRRGQKPCHCGLCAQVSS